MYHKLYPYMVILCITPLYAMDSPNRLIVASSLKEDALPTLTARVEHFHNLLTSHVTTHGNLKDFQSGIQSDQESLFDECHDDSLLFERYADFMLEALQPDTMPSHYHARSAIVKLAAALPAFNKGVQLLDEECGPLYEAFARTRPLCIHNTYHMPVAPTFQDCHFPAQRNYCIGYVKQADDSYRLHVCESSTGLPLWISPLKSMIKHPYSVSGDSLYYAGDAQSLLKLDLKTYGLDEVQTNTLEDIYKIHALDNDSCYVLHEQSVSLIDLITKRKKRIKLPEEAFCHKAFFADNCLIVPTPTDFVIFNPKGTSTKIPHYCNQSALASPEAVATQHSLAYQHTSASGNRRLRFIDHISSQEMWNYPLTRNALKIMFSPSRDKLLVLTDTSLMAFNTCTESMLQQNNLPRLAWQTPVEPSEINKLHIANDGKIYGYSTHKGTFYTFDCISGQKKRVREITPSCTYEIIGDCHLDDNEMLYVKQ